MTDAPEEYEVEHPAPLREALEALNFWCQERLADGEAKDRVEAPLYHYTNATGLKGIFESGEMWFTDYRHLNDPSELRYGVERAHKALRGAKSGDEGLVDWFLEGTADLFSLENLDTLGFFVSSFSRARNDLGQWRAYADNGRGFAIGYAPSMFKIRPDLSPSPEENAFRGTVVYDADEGLSRQREVADHAAQNFGEVLAANVELMKDKAVGIPFMRDYGRRLISSSLIWNALTTKHPAYEREQEVRLIIMGTVEKLLPVTKTRARASEIVPYIAHPWNIRGREDVAEIVIGPGAHPDSERTVETLLATRGLTGVKITRSDIPYRAI